MLKESDARRSLDWKSLLYLIPGALLLSVSNGRIILPWASWIALTLLLLFVRREPPVRGLVVTAVTMATVQIIAFRGVIPIPGALYYIVVANLGLCSTLPFVADRLLARSLPSQASTLVFPLAWVSLEYASSLVSPYGTWGTLGYTQHSFALLTQIASVTGIWGIGFLIPWFASTACLIFECWSKKRKAVPAFLAYAVTLAVVLLYGAVRLALPGTGKTDVQMAALVIPGEVNERLEEAWDSHADRSGMIQAQGDCEETLFRRSRAAADEGARIVAWSEGAVYLRPEDEKAFIDRGKSLARGKGIILFMTEVVLPPDFPKSPGENKSVMISADGNVVAEYLKSIPVPGEASKKGPGVIPVVETQYGRIGTAICYDMDFPVFVRQAGRTGADLMIVPSSDWKEIAHIHPRMASFRSIENGFALLRPANRSVSLAADSRGIVKATLDTRRSTSEVMMATLPVRGRRTIYSRIGDAAAWLAIAGFLVLAAAALRRARSSRAARTTKHTSSAEG